MNNYHFSLADLHDVSEIMGIYQGLIGAPGCAWDMDYPNRETAEDDINNKSLYVLRDNGKIELFDDYGLSVRPGCRKSPIIAVASAGAFNELGHLPWKPKNPCELARIGVRAGMQKQGIGTIILKNVIEAVEKRGFDGIRMLVSKTNYPALSLYNKNGFEKCGETFMFDIDFYCYQMTFVKAI